MFRSFDSYRDIARKHVMFV